MSRSFLCSKSIAARLSPDLRVPRVCGAHWLRVRRTCHSHHFSTPMNMAQLQQYKSISTLDYKFKIFASTLCFISLVLVQTGRNNRPKLSFSPVRGHRFGSLRFNSSCDRKKRNDYSPFAERAQEWTEVRFCSANGTNEGPNRQGSTLRWCAVRSRR
eukprot:SAG31_NODE_3750_length_3923_cov_7.559100_3_plen_157_part_00